MIFIKPKTSPFRLTFRRAFSTLILNRGKQLYTSGLGLSIAVKEFVLKDEIIEKAPAAWSQGWLELEPQLPASARTLSLPGSPNRQDRIGSGSLD
jgi:hypothetical protein